MKYFFITVGHCFSIKSKDEFILTGNEWNNWSNILCFCHRFTKGMERYVTKISFQRKYKIIFRFQFSTIQLTFSWYKLFLNYTEYAEADCFFCFTNLMSDIRDFFIKSLDEAESGINALMGKLMSKVGRLDPGVKEVLDKQGIRPQYFSFRYTSCNHNKMGTSISNFVKTI